MSPRNLPTGACSQLWESGAISETNSVSSLYFRFFLFLFLDSCLYLLQAYLEQSFLLSLGQSFCVLVYYMYMYLKFEEGELEIARERGEREKETDGFTNCWFTLGMPTRGESLGQAKLVVTNEFHCGLPDGWQGPNHLTIFCCFCRYVTRELDLKRSSWNSNWGSDKGCWQHNEQRSCRTTMPASNISLAAALYLNS